ncbi:uncharacterized protein LOC118468185 [Anopheles albimanus]|uniref:uncharacterized protein LOC118468185 n=1 Tax=Anopheles albimanus TaxID=7167 RepID=UPI0016420622|nr:uncharacterized protein LOC118468185 [Anopheles albimanus]
MVGPPILSTKTSSSTADSVKRKINLTTYRVMLKPKANTTNKQEMVGRKFMRQSPEIVTPQPKPSKEDAIVFGRKFMRLSPEIVTPQPKPSKGDAIVVGRKFMRQSPEIVTPQPKPAKENAIVVGHKFM